jgi:hypothetical protein
VPYLKAVAWSNRIKSREIPAIIAGDSAEILTLYFLNTSHYYSNQSFPFWWISASVNVTRVVSRSHGSELMAYFLQLPPSEYRNTFEYLASDMLANTSSV